MRSRLRKIVLIVMAMLICVSDFTMQAYADELVVTEYEEENIENLYVDDSDGAYLEEELIVQDEEVTTVPLLDELSEEVCDYESNQEIMIEFGDDAEDILQQVNCCTDNALRYEYEELFLQSEDSSLEVSDEYKFETMLVVDCSASMSENDPFYADFTYGLATNITARKNICKEFYTRVSNLNKQEVVFFNNGGSILAKLGSSKTELNNTLNSICHCYNSNISVALERALNELISSGEEDTIKSIVLLSDGGADYEDVLYLMTRIF